MASSIWTRKTDMAYVLYFILHIPILFFVDLVTLYPPSLVPQFMHSLRQYNIDTFNDQFFVNPPPWFPFYIYMEVTHAPIVLWAIWALVKDHPLTPLVLLVYALHTATTTSTCIADMWYWDEAVVSKAQKWGLLGTYGPYAAIALVMAGDSAWRVGKVLIANAKAKEVVEEKKKKKRV